MNARILYKRKVIIFSIVFSFLSVFLTACDGGGGGGASDSIAPEVIYTAPVNDADSVAVNADIMVTFNEELDEATVTDTSVVIKLGDTPLNGAVQYDNNIVTIDPTLPLDYDMEYTVEISTTVTDTSGNGLAENYSFSFTTVDAPAPEIEIKQELIILEDGTGEYDFDSAILGDTKSTVFTIKNTGSAVLSIIDVILASGDLGQFSLETSTMESSLDPDETTSFSITFNPDATGDKTATVLVTSNDDDEADYSFTVAGTGNPVPVPEIAVVQGVTEIDTGDEVYDFGTATGTVPVKIQNSGTADLTIDSIVFGTGDTDQFVLSTDTTLTTVEPGSETTFYVEFAPSSQGVKNVEVIITSNDGDEGEYLVTLSGNGQPEISVKEGSTELVSGTSAITYTTISLGSTGEEKTFAIENTGAVDLTIDSVTLNSGDTGAFTVNTDGMSSTLAPGETTEFTVAFTPAAGGDLTAQVLVSCNDSDESGFAFSVSGTATEPHITVSFNGVTIDNGGAITLTDIYEIETKYSVCLMDNTGNAVLAISGVEEVSGDTDDFHVYSTSSEINPGNNSNLMVGFTPTSTGEKTVVVKITTNDPDTLEFTLSITATALVWEHGTHKIFYSGTNKGEHNSMAVAPDGTVYISSYDSTNRDLMFWKSSDGGKTWSKKIVDDTGSITGMYSNIAVSESGTVYIAYYSSSLKVAVSTDGGASFLASTIDDASTAGTYPSMIIGSDDTVYIAYKTGSDCSLVKSTLAGDWIKTDVDSSGNSFQDFSLVQKSSGDLVISYYDSTSDDLKAAVSTNDGATWSITAVDTTGNVGQKASAVVGSDDTVYVLYYNATDNTVKLATLTDGSSTWTKKDVRAVTECGGLDFIVDSNDNLYFSHVQSDAAALTYSTDAGATWTIKSALFGSSVDDPYASIARGTGGEMYMILEESSYFWLGRSIDNGLTW